VALLQNHHVTVIRQLDIALVVCAQLFEERQKIGIVGCEVFFSKNNQGWNHDKLGVENRQPRVFGEDVGALPVVLHADPHALIDDVLLELTWDKAIAEIGFSRGARARKRLAAVLDPLTIALAEFFAAFPEGCMQDQAVHFFRMFHCEQTCPLGSGGSSQQVKLADFSEPGDVLHCGVDVGRG